MNADLKYEDFQNNYSSFDHNMSSYYLDYYEYDAYYDFEYLLRNYLNFWETNHNIILSEKRPKYYVAIEIVLASIGILLNLMHGVALKCTPGSWKTNIKLIVSLAVEDIMISILHFVQNIYVFPSVLVQYALVEYGPVQTLFSWIYTTTQFAQMLTMLGLAMNLLIAIKMPLQSDRLMSPERGNIIICCFWILPALIFGLVYLLTYKLVKDNMTDALNGIFTFINFASTVSGIALVTVYSFAFYEIYNLKKRSPRLILLRKSAFTFLSILITYIVLLMPGTWLEICSYFISLDAHHYNTIVKLKSTISCMYVLNSVCDPILYAVRVPEIKDFYRNIFRKLGCNCTRETKPDVLQNVTKDNGNNTKILEAQDVA